MPDVLSIIVLVLALGGTIASYIVGGGLLAAFKGAWKVAKGLGVAGWVCVPFPADIVTGLCLTMMAIIMIPILFILLPIAFVFSNYLEVRKEFKAAEEYLKYCTPVNAAYGEGNQ